MITETIRNHLPFKTKSSPNGWISFNCPVCVHLGHRADTRSRGGIIFSHNGFSYHCFNCNFTTKWEQGSHLSKKNVDLMNYLGVEQSEIGKCKLHALGLERVENEGNDTIVEQRIYELPPNTKPFSQLVDEGCSDKNFLKVVEYIGNRNPNFLSWFDFYWSSDPKHNTQLIIPTFVHGKLVGWSGRTIKNSKVKYEHQIHKNIVFNNDLLYNDRKYCLIVEGQLDAISLDCTAVMSNTLTVGQAQQYDTSKQIKIVLPDKDKSGKELIDIALDKGWWVSLPDWPEKDASDAVAKYGRLVTLTHIFQSIHKTPLKIQLHTKKYISGN